MDDLDTLNANDSLIFDRNHVRRAGESTYHPDEVNTGALDSWDLMRSMLCCTAASKMVLISSQAISTSARHGFIVLLPRPGEGNR